MKKLLAIFILFFISYGAANAGVKEPGKINSLQCAIGTLDAYKEAKEYRASLVVTQAKKAVDAC